MDRSTTSSPRLNGSTTTAGPSCHRPAPSNWSRPRAVPIRPRSSTSSSNRKPSPATNASSAMSTASAATAGRRQRNGSTTGTAATTGPVTNYYASGAATGQSPTTNGSSPPKPNPPPRHPGNRPPQGPGHPRRTRAGGPVRRGTRTRPHHTPHDAPRRRTPPTPLRDTRTRDQGQAPLVVNRVSPATRPRRPDPGRRAYEAGLHEAPAVDHLASSPQPARRNPNSSGRSVCHRCRDTQQRRDHPDRHGVRPVEQQRCRAAERLTFQWHPKWLPFAAPNTASVARHLALANGAAAPWIGIGEHRSVWP